MEMNLSLRNRGLNGPPGLCNVSDTCYLNSAFQGISACDTFVKEVNDLYLHYKNDDLKNLLIFKELIDVLNGCSKPQMKISNNPLFYSWNKYGQQDSYELLAYALNQVYNNIRKHKEFTNEISFRDLNSWLHVKLPMRFLLQYNIECKCKMKTVCPLQTDLALHLLIPVDKEKYHIDELLDLHFMPDYIIDYKCEKIGCTETSPAKFVRLCKPLPKTICVHLQRTYWNGLRMLKIENFVKFDKTLKIKSEICMNSISKCVVDEDIREDIYDLVSVIVHSGSVHFGHYICYKKVDNKWFLTNDSTVFQVPEKTVFECQAYILFYEQSY